LEALKPNYEYKSISTDRRSSPVGVNVVRRGARFGEELVTSTGPKYVTHDPGNGQTHQAPRHEFSSCACPGLAHALQGHTRGQQADGPFQYQQPTEEGQNDGRPGPDRVGRDKRRARH